VATTVMKRLAELRVIQPLPDNMPARIHIQG
jgi:hypothetical protein